MTRGQIAQLRELEKCWNLDRFFSGWVWSMNVIANADPSQDLAKIEKAWLRRLQHQYRHQIAAMRKNRGKV
jgi:hypothetical protein